VNIEASCGYRAERRKHPMLADAPQATADQLLRSLGSLPATASALGAGWFAI